MFLYLPSLPLLCEDRSCSGKRKFVPKPRNYCNVWANTSYLRMSLSLNDRLANFIVSSKWFRRISGTRSNSSVSTEVCPLRCRSFSRARSFSIDSRMTNLHAHWHISVKSGPLKPLVTLAKYCRSTSLAIGDFLKAWVWDVVVVMNIQ